jgi:UDP-glucuronate decarboxylase
MAASRRLVTGGARFLGYYSVHAIHHHNRGVAQRERVLLTVYDNYVRGLPRWLDELDDRLDIPFEHDLTLSLPADMDDFDHAIDAASIASPNAYRALPDNDDMVAGYGGSYPAMVCRGGSPAHRDDGRQRRRPSRFARPISRQQELGRPVGGFLFVSSSEIYGDPLPDWIPTPETYRGHVCCTGPRHATTKPSATGGALRHLRPCAGEHS